MIWYCFDKKSYYTINLCAHRWHFTWPNYFGQIDFDCHGVPVHRKMHNVNTFSVKTMYEYDTHFTKYYMQSFMLNDSLAHRKTFQSVTKLAWLKYFDTRIATIYISSGKRLADVFRSTINPIILPDTEAPGCFIQCLEKLSNERHSYGANCAIRANWCILGILVHFLQSKELFSLKQSN